MKLSNLLTSLTLESDRSPMVQGIPDSAPGADPEILSLHYRSQDVTPGGLFVAIRGLTADGHDFAGDAVRRGAVAVVAETPVHVPAAVVRVSDSRRALADLAAAFYSHPSDGLTVIGVTGTNGKTTVTYLIESILSAAGHRTGVIGTVNIRYPGTAMDSSRTTPESLDIQRHLSRMRAVGCTHAILEAASHGIALDRLAQIRFDVAAFTNLTQDHLDFHRDMERYWAAKRRLFTDLLRHGPKAQAAVAVINRDDARGRELFDSLTGPKLSFGHAPDCDVHPVRHRSDLRGIRATLSTGGGAVAITSKMVGHHNLENMLCAAGVAVALGIPTEIIASGIEGAAAAPGRLEPVRDPSGRFVFVDYAHTPDALENVLNALNAVKTRHLICVFGCGGDRDRQKRPLMGAIAVRLSDLAVVTSDNPRSEPPLSIIDDILKGIDDSADTAPSGMNQPSGSGRPCFLVEPDRRKAIHIALSEAAAGDIVLIAGKGHERYQIVGDRTLHFDDREEAMAVLQQSVQFSAGATTPR